MLKEMPSLNMPVQRLKVTLVLPCSGPVTHSGEILTTGKSHGKKPDRFSLNDNMDDSKWNTFNCKQQQQQLTYSTVQSPS